MLKAESMVQI